MTLWCKKNHYPPRWICITHIWLHTLFPRGIITFQGVLTKFHFLTKFPHLEKIVHLMKDLKCEHQSTFPLWKRYGKPNIYSRNSSCYQVFSSNSQKMTLWCKNKIITHPDGFVWPIYSPLHYSLGYYNFPWSTNKFNFLTKFPHLEKNCRFNEGPKI